MRLASKKLVTTIVGGALAAGGVATAVAPAAYAASYTPVSYDAVGSSHIGAQVNADVKLGPAKFNARLDFDTNKFDQGTLPLPANQITFKVFNTITLRATVNFIQSGQITGNLANDAADNVVVTANAKYTIKLTNVQQAGLIPGTWIPLFVGNSCQTTNPVSLNLKTPAGQNFDIGNGGTLTSKYSIGQFQNCNVLVFPGVGSLLVNALVPGSNNTATVNLSNGKIG